MPVSSPATQGCGPEPDPAGAAGLPRGSERGDTEPARVGKRSAVSPAGGPSLQCHPLEAVSSAPGWRVAARASRAGRDIRKPARGWQFPPGARGPSGRDGVPAGPVSEPVSPPPAPALDSAAAGDLTDALCEFDAVLADFASPFHERHFHYEEHLERMKRRSSASVSDSSGFSDSESECAPAGKAPRGLGLPICSLGGGARRREPTARGGPEGARRAESWGQDPGRLWGASGRPCGRQVARAAALPGAAGPASARRDSWGSSLPAAPSAPLLPPPPRSAVTFQRMWSEWRRHGGGRGRGRARC